MALLACNTEETQSSLCIKFHELFIEIKSQRTSASNIGGIYLFDEYSYGWMFAVRIISAVVRTSERKQQQQQYFVIQSDVVCWSQYSLYCFVFWLPLMLLLCCCCCVWYVWTLTHRSHSAHSSDRCSTNRYIASIIDALQRTEHELHWQIIELWPC